MNTPKQTPVLCLSEHSSQRSPILYQTFIFTVFLLVANVAVAVPGDGFCECNSDGNTWHADDSNFQEIQLDCAKSGDTILMAPGTYYSFQYAPGYRNDPGFFAVIYPQGRSIIYKKDPNSSGEVILSGLCYSSVGGTVFFPPLSDNTRRRERLPTYRLDHLLQSSS